MKKKTNTKEAKKMRKTLMTMFIVLLSLVLVYGYADAITGECSNCHTMHNSQDGAAVDAGGPNERLLSAGCVACHTGTDAEFNTNSGKTGDGAPIVLRTTADPGGQGGTDTLAGGDFYWVANGSDATGHNVEGVATEDVILGSDPPGWDQTATTGLTFDSKTLQVTGGVGWTGARLTCAGTFGCHGTRDGADLAGIQGSHHNNLNLTATQANVTNTTTVGSSYRFLADIYGLEESAWNYSETAASHNEYYGVDDASDRQYDIGTTVYSDTNTISFLCAECHGEFHSKVANDNAYLSGDPWRRHPTDLALPSSGEYTLYNTSDGSTIGGYSVEAPVARPSVPADCTNCATVTAGTDVVMCLSCHRAHGSNEADLLRWTYSNMVAGDTNSGGCFVCHTTKNASGTNP